MSELNVPNAEPTGLTPRVDDAVENRRGIAWPAHRTGRSSYDEARTIWNAMIDRRPALIARCCRNADVRTALRFARDHSLPVAVRGGGHNMAGTAVCDAGMVLDFSLMGAVHVDSRRGVAHVEAGCTLGDEAR